MRSRDKDRQRDASACLKRKKMEKKKEAVKNFKEMFSKSTLTIVTDYRGFTVAEITDLRKRLHKNNADYKIAKNTLIKLAAKETNLTELEKFLKGPSAILLSFGDPSACAKTFVEFIKEIKKGEKTWQQKQKNFLRT